MNRKLLKTPISISSTYKEEVMADFLDFGDIEVKPKFKEKYKGVPGEKHRIAIIWPEKMDTTKKGPFVVRHTHFEQKYFVCKEGICCEKLGPAKTRIACLVIKYKTKKDGSLVKKEGEKIPFDFEVLEWILSETKYNKLKDLHKEFPLKDHDLMVTLEGTEQYQDLNFTPCKESVWQARDEFKREVYKESEPLRENLARSLGQDLSIDEIKELLGMGVAQPSEAITNASNIEDILSAV